MMRAMSCATKVAASLLLVVAVATPAVSGRASAASNQITSITVSFSSAVSSALWTVTEADWDTTSSTTSYLPPADPVISDVSGHSSPNSTSLNIPYAPTATSSLLILSINGLTASAPGASVTDVSDSSGNSWTSAAQVRSASSRVGSAQFFLAQGGYAVVDQTGSSSATSSSASVATASPLTHSGDLVVANVGWLTPGNLTGQPAGYTLAPTNGPSSSLNQSSGYEQNTQSNPVPSYSQPGFGGSITSGSQPLSKQWAATITAFSPVVDVSALTDPVTGDPCSAELSTDATNCINEAIEDVQDSYQTTTPSGTASEYSLFPQTWTSSGVGEQPTSPNTVYFAPGTYVLDSSACAGADNTSVVVSSQFPPGDVGDASYASGSSDNPVELHGVVRAGTPVSVLLAENLCRMVFDQADGTVVDGLDLNGNDYDSGGPTVCPYPTSSSPVCGALVDFGTNANDVTLEDFHAEGSNSFIPINFAGPQGQGNQQCTASDDTPFANNTECSYLNSVDDGVVETYPNGGNGAVVMENQAGGVVDGTTVSGDYIGDFRSSDLNYPVEFLGDASVETPWVSSHPYDHPAWETGAGYLVVGSAAQPFTVAGTASDIGAGDLRACSSCAFGPATGDVIADETVSGSTNPLEIGDVDNLRVLGGSFQDVDVKPDAQACGQWASAAVIQSGYQVSCPAMSSSVTVNFADGAGDQVICPTQNPVSGCS